MISLNTKYNTMKKIYALLMFIIPLMGYAQNIHVVTFKVNTANITVGPNGLFLGGGIIGGANEVQLLDPDGNGIYEGTRRKGNGVKLSELKSSEVR